MFQATILSLLIIKLRRIRRQKERHKSGMLHMETLSALAVMRLGIILHLNYLAYAMALHERQNMLLMLLVLFAPAPLESVPDQGTRRIKHGDENVDPLVNSGRGNLDLGTFCIHIGAMVAHSSSQTSSWKPMATFFLTGLKKSFCSLSPFWLSLRSRGLGW